MSALTAHIRVLRAEALKLAREADKFSGETPQQVTAKFMLLSLSNAKFAAADALEAEDREQEAKVAK